MPTIEPRGHQIASLLEERILVVDGAMGTAIQARDLHGGDFGGPGVGGCNEFLVESRPLARKLTDTGVSAVVADPRRVDTYVRADVTPNTCIILEDNGRRSLKRIVTAIRDAGGCLRSTQRPTH